MMAAFFAKLRRSTSVRLRITLWNVGALAFILGAMGAVVRYAVQADRFAAVDRTLAERAQEAGRLYALGPPYAVEDSNGDLPRLREPTRGNAEGSFLGSRPGALPPLSPRVVSRESNRARPWVRATYVRSLDGQTAYSTVWNKGWPIRVLSMPVERRGRIEEVVQLAYPLDGVLKEIDGLTSTLLTLAPFGLLAAGLGGALLTGRALRPVREIAETAGRLGANDLSERLPVSGHDEFAELSSSFNAMLARLEEAFERQRRFTADASHELRTPLSIIKANTGLALERPWTEARYREFLAAIDAAANRQGRIVEELLFLARTDAGGSARDVGLVCLAEALEEAVEAVSRPGRPNIRLEPVDPSLMARGSGSELTRLFINVLDNGVRHTPPEGEVSVSATVDASVATVTIVDHGEGIAPEHLPRLGERFYRVDAARSLETGGNGLGLAICRSIVESHGGRMTIESKVGEGTTVRVWLALAGPTSGGAQTRGSASLDT